jgi:hypothetical protein
VVTIPLATPRSMLCVSWDLDREAYRLRRCLRASAISRSVSDHDDEGTPVELFVVMAEVATQESPGAIAAAAANDAGRLPVSSRCRRPSPSPCHNSHPCACRVRCGRR